MKRLNLKHAPISIAYDSTNHVCAHSQIPPPSPKGKSESTLNWQGQGLVAQLSKSKVALIALTLIGALKTWKSFRLIRPSQNSL